MTCPRRPIYDDGRGFEYYLRLYKNYKAGMLPERGALLDQCNFVMRVMDVLDNAFAEVREFKQEEANRKGSGGQPQARGGRRISSRGGMTSEP
jgi:hypothetical protein